MRLSRKLREALAYLIEELESQGYKNPQTALANALMATPVTEEIFIQAEWAATEGQQEEESQ